MSASVNKVIMIGNLGKDPEVRNSQDGKKVVTLSLATNESWKDKTTGDRKERTEWHRIVIFNDVLAEIAARNLKKGAKIYVEGQLQTRKWLDNSGSENFITEVVLPRYKGDIVMLSNSIEPHVGGEDYTKHDAGIPFDSEIPF